MLAQVAHRIPLYHRDICWSTIIRRVEDQSKWFIINWEDAASPTTLAQEDFTTKSHSPAIKWDGHGAEVDIWGVGHLIVTNTAVDISANFRALGIRICAELERLSAQEVYDLVNEYTV